MERGPAALFGALVAVGLGPALWVGAQLGERAPAPPAPIVQSEQRQTSEPRGGSGAEADEPEVLPPPRNTTDDKPATKPKPRKSPSSRAESPASSKPSLSASPSPSASSESTTTPGEDEPSGPPAGGGAEESAEAVERSPAQVLPEVSGA